MVTREWEGLSSRTEGRRPDTSKESQYDGVMDLDNHLERTQFELGAVLAMTKIARDEGNAKHILEFYQPLATCSYTMMNVVDAKALCMPSLADNDKGAESILVKEKRSMAFMPYQWKWRRHVAYGPHWGGQWKSKKCSALSFW